MSFPCAALSDSTLFFCCCFFCGSLMDVGQIRALLSACSSKANISLQLLYSLHVQGQTGKRPIWLCSCRKCIAFSCVHSLCLPPSHTKQSCIPNNITICCAFILWSHFRSRVLNPMANRGPSNQTARAETGLITCLQAKQWGSRCVFTEVTVVHVCQTVLW